MTKMFLTHVFSIILHKNKPLIFLSSFSCALLQFLQMKYLNVVLDSTSGFLIITFALLFVSIGGGSIDFINSKLNFKPNKLIYYSQILFLFFASISLFLIRNITYIPDVISLSKEFSLSSIVLLTVAVPYFFIGVSLAGLLFPDLDRKFELGGYAIDMFGIFAAGLLPLYFVPILGPERLMCCTLIIHSIVFGHYFIFKNKLLDSFLVIYVITLLFNFYIAAFTASVEPMNTLVKKYKPNQSNSLLEYSTWDLNARIDIIDFNRNSTAVSSIKYLFYDGGTIGTNIYNFDGDFEKLKLNFSDDPEKYFLRRGTVAAHYLKEKTGQKVFLFGVGAGQELKAALMYSPSNVVANELIPAVLKISRQQYAEYNGGIFNDPRVQISAGDGRLSLNRQKSKFDIIQIFSNYLSANMISGLSPFMPTYLFTEESIQEYIECLTPEGILQINQYNYFKIMYLIKSVWNKTNRSTDLKQHIFVIHNTINKDHLPTILFKNSAFTKEDYKKINELFKYKTASYEKYEFLENPFEEVTNSVLKEKKRNTTLNHTKAVSDDRPFFLYSGYSYFNSYRLNKTAYIFFNLVLLAICAFLIIKNKISAEKQNVGRIILIFLSGFLYIFSQHALHSKLLKYLDIPALGYHLLILSFAISSILSVLLIKKISAYSRTTKLKILVLLGISSLTFLYFFDDIMKRISIEYFSLSFSFLTLIMMVFISIITAQLFPLLTATLNKAYEFRMAWLLNGIGVISGALSVNGFSYNLGLNTTLGFSALTAFVISILITLFYTQ